MAGQDKIVAESIEQQILLTLKGIRFGSIEITVHDSRVVQIERKEKMRIGTGRPQTIR